MEFLLGVSVGLAVWSILVNRRIKGQLDRADVLLEELEATAAQTRTYTDDYHDAPTHTEG